MKASEIGVERMPCGEPENVKKWSLTLFRHGPQGLVDELCEAHFRFGRFSSEVEFTRVATLPKAIVNCVKRAGLEAEALESGFEVEISISKKSLRKDVMKVPGKEEGWVGMDMVAEGYEAYRGFGRKRWSFCVCDSSDTMEIVQANPHTGKEMPGMIWIRVTELKPGSLLWAMDNEILSCGEEESNSKQDTLERWVSIEKGFKVGVGEDVKEVKLPGQPFGKYEFNQ